MESKVKRRSQQPLVSQDRKVQTHKLLIAAHQLYLPKKVAMTMAFMVSKAKSGCVTKEHWKGKEEYIRLHLEVSQLILEQWGKRVCIFLQPFTVLTCCLLFSCFIEQLMSLEEMVVGLWHFHGLLFYFCPRFAFCLRKARFNLTGLFLKPVAGEGTMGTDMLWQLFNFIHYFSKAYSQKRIVCTMLFPRCFCSYLVIVEGILAWVLIIKLSH